MSTFIMIAQLLLSLSILVFVHELGHFLAAKFFKTRVDRFYLFFDFLFPLPNVLNFALFKKKIGETEYGLGWFPLGGYVSIAGMVDETTDKDQLAAEPQPWEYRSKKGWQKMIIILGGIIFNLIFAALIYASLMKFVEKEYMPASSLAKGGVSVSNKAKQLGFQDGDYILKVNGKSPERYKDLTPISMIFGGSYVVQRMENGVPTEKEIKMPSNLYKKLSKDMFIPAFHEVVVDSVIPQSNASLGGLLAGDKLLSINNSKATGANFMDMIDSNLGKLISMEVDRKGVKKLLQINVDSVKKTGFYSGTKLLMENYKTKPYGLFQAIRSGVEECASLFVLQGVSIGKMFSGEMKVKDNVGGPVAMAKAFGSEWNWLRFWLFTAMISVGLAFMNLLPIPALDGGHAVIILIEMITGKPINEKVLQVLQNIGTVLILGLMVFAFYNDLTRK